MTEDQFQFAYQPDGMTAYLCDDRNKHRTKAGRRKLRLFLCACVRLVWNPLDHEEFREGVDAEHLAEGTATDVMLSDVQVSLEELRLEE